MSMTIIEILAKLEDYRHRLSTGESTPGCIDHVIRMCQAKVAEGAYTNRNDWIDELRALNLVKREEKQ